jgi:DNA replication and repair protein RecF
MDLEHISITRFRNFGKVDEIVLPHGGLLVAAAPNAAGKTNFLESVAVLLRGRSFRARTEDCVRWGYDAFSVEGKVVRSSGESYQLAVRYHRPSRKLRIEENGVPASVVTQYAHYPLVLFLPEDTFLFSRGPGARRNFLNQVLVAHPHYVSALVQYNRVLTQRNALLKQAAQASSVGSWTELLAEHAEILWRHREGFAAFVHDQLSDMYGRLSGEARRFTVQLVFGAKRRDNFVAELNGAFSVERRLGFTSLGPHRDDLFIATQERPVKVALSRGQVRTLVIALKVLTCHYLKQVTEEEPLLLLDDALSELDEGRQQALLENLPATQTLLTCTTVPQTLQQREDVFLLDVRTIVDRVVRVRKEGAATSPAAPLSGEEIREGTKAAVLA